MTTMSGLAAGGVGLGGAGWRLRGAIGLLAAMGMAVMMNPTVAGAATPQIGMNLVELTSRSADIPFVDVFKMSSPWRAINVDPTRASPPPPLTLDSHGWVARLEPGQEAVTRIFENGSGHYPGGTYSLFYSGAGDIAVKGAGVSVVDARPGAMKIRVVPTPGPDGGITIIERRTDPADPLRRIRLILPSFETRSQTDPFNPKFLAALAPFKTLRFMNWDEVMRSTATDWQDRRPSDYATQALPVCCPAHRMTGVALEFQIDLANRLNADPWFNIPPMASDDYVARMAALVRDRLRPNLHPYLEYGNELWNPTFREGFDYVTKQGLDAGLSADPKLARRYQYATRAHQVFTIWSEVFGAQSRRVRTVIAGNLDDLTFDDDVLPYMKAHGWTADALAVAAYIMPRDLETWKPVGPEFYEAVLALSPDDIVARLEAEVTQVDRPLFLKHAAQARHYGMSLVAYEGGQGLAGMGMDARYVPQYRERVGAAFTAANRRPAMAKVYRDLLDAWFGAGGTLFLHQGFIQEPAWWGSWGLLEYQDQDPATAVKYRAVTDYLHEAEARR